LVTSVFKISIARIVIGITIEKKIMKDYKLENGSSIFLDLIRGVSAQIVVVGHGLSFFGILKLLHEPNFPWMQNIAVLIFFLLSGFLITYSTVRKILNGGNYSFSHYFADRFSRIYTAFIPSLIFVLILDLISISLDPALYSYTQAFDIKTFVGNLFMLQDYPLFHFASSFIVTSFGSARPFWTLAIEWWIYLSFGYLLLVILKKNKASFLNILVLSFFSVVPIFNLIIGRGNGLTTYWLFGSLVYIVSTLDILNGLNKNIKIILILITTGLALVRAYIKMEAYDPIFAFLLAVVLWLVIDFYKNKEYSKNTIKLIKYNASFSYTLYLVHYSILAFIKTHLGASYNPYVLFIVAFIAANIISILIGRYTELSLTKKVKLFLYEKIETRKIAKKV
jgi:peptidoglycan/LPS O-acetylase OafA/YrhL